MPRAHGGPLRRHSLIDRRSSRIQSNVHVGEAGIPLRRELRSVAMPTYKEDRVVQSPAPDAVDLSPDGHRFCLGRDKVVQVWNVHRDSEPVILQRHKDIVVVVAWSPCGKWIASSSIDNTTRIWQSDSGELKNILFHRDRATDLKWSPDGSEIAISVGPRSSGEMTVTVWDLASGANIQSFPGEYGVAGGVSWSADRAYIASNCGDGIVHIWDVDSGLELRGVAGCDELPHLAWSPNGQFLAFGRNGNSVVIWNLRERSVRTVLPSQGGPVASVCWLDSGETIATGGSDGAIRLWHVETGEQVQILEGHSFRVTRLAVSSNRSLLLSAAHHTVRLWRK